MPLSNAPTLGVFGRFPADWNVEYAADVSAFVNPSGNFGQVSLFNNATDGTALGVYGWNIAASSNTSDIYFTFLRGSQGTFGFNGQALDPSAATPWGQVYFATPASAAAQSTWLYQTVRGSFQSCQFMRSARFVILPGYSLCVNSNNTGVSLNCAFWYYQMAQP